MSENQQLYIPEKIKVGYQERDDTYTKKLAYVIYYDMKGVLRKEKSWQSWRDNKIEPSDFVNEPMEGFVLNKKVGGYRSDWNYRSAHIRVYDPRGFEFEIDVPNLLFILTQCDCSRGKGLEGKFVYAWNGTELVLLPERCESFQNSKKYTMLQAQKVKAKDLVAGASYLTKKQQLLTYLGKFDYHSMLGTGCSWRKQDPAVCKKFVFWTGKEFECLDNVSTIAATAQLESTPDLAELTQLYYKSPHGSPVKKLSLRKIPENLTAEKFSYRSTHSWFVEEKENVFKEYYSERDYYDTPDTKQVNSICCSTIVTFENGVITVKSIHDRHWRPGSPGARNYGRTTNGFIEPTNMALWVTLESGEEFRYQGGTLYPSTEAIYDGEEDDDCDD